MEQLNLSQYGNNFMSIINFDSFFIQIKKDLKSNDELLIDFKNVNNVSPSFMTRFINRLYDELNFVDIKIENANKRLETTFKFALYSISQKATC
jgi:hypothetical protein